MGGWVSWGEPVLFELLNDGRQTQGGITKEEKKCVLMCHWWNVEKHLEDWAEAMAEGMGFLDSRGSMSWETHPAEELSPGLSVA